MLGCDKRLTKTHLECFNTYTMKHLIVHSYLHFRNNNHARNVPQISPPETGNGEYTKTAEQ